MSIVLTDVPVITATLVSTAAPQPVQLVITGLTAGATVVLTGTAAGSSWPVPGGQFVSDGSQVVLVDNRAPLNIPVVYEALVEGGSYLSNEVTVTYTKKYVLQSLDGQTVVDFVWVDDGVPQEQDIRVSVFSVPGRSRPPIRYATAGDGGGSLTLRTTAANTALLRFLVTSSRPLVLRTDGAVRDLPPVELVLPTTARTVLWPGLGGISSDRVWSVSYLLVDDPEPGTPLAAWTWDDFDLAMSTRTWADFDALFSGLTWDDFDKYDYGMLL